MAKKDDPGTAVAAGVPGATVVEQPGDRTADEKQKSLAAATKRADQNEEGLSLLELNAGIKQLRRGNRRGLLNDELGVSHRIADRSCTALALRQGVLRTGCSSAYCVSG